MQHNLSWNHGYTLGFLVALVGCTAGDAFYKSTLEVPPGGIASSSLDEFVRIRGSLSPSDDVYFYFRGEIFAAELPNEGTSTARRFRKPLLYLEGVNVARFIPTENGFRMLSREVAYYLDAEGEIVDCLTLDWRDEPVRVLHIANDPVNFTLSAPASHLLGAMKVYVVNASVDYPSPLGTRDDVDDYGGKTYQSTELFQFFARRSDLAGSAPSVPAWLSWSRVGQPLPWMRSPLSDNRYLVYHTRGHKVLDGFEGLPRDLRQRIKTSHPKFTHAPMSEVPGGRNQTSWSAFEQALRLDGYDATCQKVAE